MSTIFKPDNKSILNQYGIDDTLATVQNEHDPKNSSWLRQAAIFSVVSIVLAGIALYVLYAGNAGPNPLWNLSSHTLHQTAAFIAGTGGGLAAIAMISALCRRALNTRQAQHHEHSPPQAKLETDKSDDSIEDMGDYPYQD